MEHRLLSQEAPFFLNERERQQAMEHPLFLANSGKVVEVPMWIAGFNLPWLAESESGLSWEDSPSMQHWKDLAWQVQDDTERVLLARATWLRETTGAKNLRMAGGVVLNCVANGRIVREAGFDNVWIQPAADHDGIAIGCAYYGHLAIQKEMRSFVMTHPYLGAAYSDKEVRKVTDRRLVRMEMRRTSRRDICADTARC